MIEWSKRYVCDGCNVLSSRKKPKNTYTLTLSRTGKSFTLCEDCIKELSDAIQDIMKEEEIK